MEFEEIMPRRALGEGHWDKRLKQRMTELSVADNYDDCKHEWIVTENVWYIPFGEDANVVLPEPGSPKTNILDEFNFSICLYNFLWQHFCNISFCFC